MIADIHSTSHRRKKPRTFLWTILSVSVYLILIAALSGIDGPDGKPWIDTNVFGEALKTLGLVGAAFGPALRDLVRDTRAVKYEVKNDHASNLRVEGDARHAEVIRRLDDLAEGHRSTRIDTQELSGELRDVRTEIREDRKNNRISFSAVFRQIAELRHRKSD